MKKLPLLFIALLSALMLVDGYAATSVAQALNPVKKEINDMVTFGLVIVWLIGIFWGVAWKGLIQSNFFAMVIGVIIPSVCTALAMLHQFT